MATITPSLTFGELYRDPAINPFGDNEAEAHSAYRVLYSEYRVSDSPPTVEELEREILTDFREPIGAIGIMVAGAGSKSGRLKLTHGHASYTIRPGRGHVDRGATFCYEGELEGTDACTVAFDRNQLGMTPYINVAQMPDRHLSLLEGEPTKAMVGPFEASDANVHTIRTRTAMFIPFELVSSLLGKDLTACEAFL
jgi:hypothetical protein